jgi:carbonic anhydrase
MNKLPSLFENNREWARRIKEDHPDFFKELSKGQSPKYLWIGCSDSRVPATEILDLSPGDIFVHRNIANLVVHSDLNCQSVIQYAVSVLKVKHVIVCGHYGCGGVKAAMQKQSLGLIDNWLLHIKDTYKRHEEKISAINDEQERVNKLCELNVHAQVMNVCHSPFVQEAWKNGQKLSVHGWIYSLEEGLIKDLDLCISSVEETADVFQIK